MEATEERLAAQRPIAVPTIVLHVAADGVSPVWSSEGHGAFSPGLITAASCQSPAHFLPQEAPGAVIEALRELCPAP